MPTVRNVKYANRKDHNIYIGRTVYGNYGEVYRKGSPLANPYKEERKATEAERDEERKRVIALYGIWLRDKVKDGDPRVWQALRDITEASVLQCYCYPKRCHGEKIVHMWSWLKSKGLIEPLHTNHSDQSTLKHMAHSNLVTETTTVERHGDKGKDRTITTTAALLEKHIAPGPLEVEQITRAIADARLDEQILETHAIDCDHCVEKPAPVNSLQRTLPPKKKQGIGAPRRNHGIVYVKADVRYNRMDEIAADLEELYTTSEYIADTRELVTTAA